MSSAERFITSLDERVRAILDACSSCGACVDVCPTPALLEAESQSGDSLRVTSAERAAGVLDILRDPGAVRTPVQQAAAQWAAACCGTGACLTVCEQGINPRFMLAMTRRAMHQGEDTLRRREAGKRAFKTMSRGVRVLSRLQLSPDLLERLSPASHPEHRQPADLVFYTGCNLLKTPHIGLLCLDVLDRLGVRYEVHGGPSSCCGILQMRPGDTLNAGRQGLRTLQRLADTGSSEILSWCPTCQIQFGETVLPSFAIAPGRELDMTMFPVYLARRIADLAPHMLHPVPKRVALCEFPGAPGVMDAVHTLLGRVPALEVVDLQHSAIGYQLSSLSALPRQRDKKLATLLARAEQAGVDSLVGIFHGDHRELVGHQPHWTFEVQNYMELIGASLGLAREDTYKRLKLMGDVDAILGECADLIAANDLDPTEVREVILVDMLGDQLLPADRALHPIVQA